MPVAHCDIFLVHSTNRKTTLTKHTARNHGNIIKSKKSNAAPQSTPVVVGSQSSPGASATMSRTHQSLGMPDPSRAHPTSNGQMQQHHSHHEQIPFDQQHTVAVSFPRMDDGPSIWNQEQKFQPIVQSGPVTDDSSSTTRTPQSVPSQGETSPSTASRHADDSLLLGPAPLDAYRVQADDSCKSPIAYPHHYGQSIGAPGGNTCEWGHVFSGPAANEFRFPNFEAQSTAIAHQQPAMPRNHVFSFPNVGATLTPTSGPAAFYTNLHSQSPVIQASTPSTATLMTARPGNSSTDAHSAYGTTSHLMAQHHSPYYSMFATVDIGNMARYSKPVWPS